jgi:hypothetical protein
MSQPDNMTGALTGRLVPARWDGEAGSPPSRGAIAGGAAEGRAPAGGGGGGGAAGAGAGSGSSHAAGAGGGGGGGSGSGHAGAGGIAVSAAWSTAWPQVGQNSAVSSTSVPQFGQ